ncbi:MAG: hypothetical protein NTY47_03365 [Candidatus Omnitrophica bacterium]|nr:hypothetical protein [Candidatus Omnitrophota bacterium]
MREHLGFLKTSSTVVKIAAWIFLFLGLLGIVSIFIKNAGYPKAMVLLGSAIYVFIFFLFFLIAKIADLLVKIINEIKKE